MLDEARTLVAGGKRVVVLASQERLDGIRPALPTAHVVTIGSEATPSTVAARLYAALREADALGADAILMCDLSGPSGIEAALRDRVQRAADRIVGT